VAIEGWIDDTPEHQKTSIITCLDDLKLVLQTSPEVQNLKFSMLSHVPSPANLYELITIRGDPDIVNHDWFKLIDVLLGRIELPYGDSIAVYTHGCDWGITTPDPLDGTRTFAMLWSWVSPEQRIALVDPAPPKSGKASDYEQLLTDQLRSAEAKGVVVEKTLLYMRRWPFTTRKKKRTRLCLIQ
jgi:hypothetical protein